MMLAVGELYRSLHGAENELRGLKKTNNDLFGTLSETNSYLNTIKELRVRLERDVQEFKRKKINHIPSRMRHLHDRLSEYSKIQNSWKEHLDKSGVTNSVTHRAICKLSSELNSLEEKQKSLQATLDGYNSLPPNFSLAREKIEEGKIQLQRLETEFKERCAAMYQ